MKRRLLTLAIKSAIFMVLLLGMTVGILSLPSQVEGVYSTGKLMRCKCFGSHYLRFHDGFVMTYSTSHEHGNLLGRYEVRSDGSVAIYMTPLRKSDPEYVGFTLRRPLVGFAFASMAEEFASTPEDSQSYLLMRIPTTGEIADLIAHQEVSQVSIPDETVMVTTFYNSALSVVREESKPIKSRRAEPWAGGWNAVGVGK